MAMAMAMEPDIAPATASETAAITTQVGAATGTRQRRGWLRRMMPRGYYSPMGVEQGTAPGRAPEMAPISPVAAVDEGAEKPRCGWLRRLTPQEYAQRRRWKNLGCGSCASRLAGMSRSLRWKRLSRLSVSLRSSWASALLDAVAFRVMYVAEAVVLGLALSCFFCCCGCQI